MRFKFYGCWKILETISFTLASKVRCLQVGIFISIYISNAFEQFKVIRFLSLPKHSLCYSMNSLFFYLSRKYGCDNCVHFESVHFDQ